jgi:hypothetical protein
METAKICWMAKQETSRRDRQIFKFNPTLASDKNATKNVAYSNCSFHLKHLFVVQLNYKVFTGETSCESNTILKKLFVYFGKE